MRNLKYITQILFFLSISSIIIADEIGFVVVNNNAQVDVIKQILPYAHARFDNKFLVSINDSQKKLLINSGFEFELLYEEVVVSEYSIVIPPDKPIYAGFDLQKLAGITSLNNNLLITNLSQTTSLSTSETFGYNFIPLNESEIRFSYLPQTVSNLVDVLNYPTDSIADLVSIDSIIVFNKRLEAFQTRYIWSDSIHVARDWIVQKFLDWGYTDVTTPTFEWGGGTHYNVMAVKLGYAEPEQVIVIGGHYDAIVFGQTPGPTIFAPGSDDNGSGTTAILELARILADIPLRKTIIFMPFSAEEVGLIGSSFAARSFVDDSIKIEAMYNFDMIGYTEDNVWDLNFSSGTNDAYVNISMAAAERVTSLIPLQIGLRASSDHWPFHQQGYNICYTAEGDFNTLGWHTNLDLSSRMDFPYMTEVIKMSAAAIGVVGNSSSPVIIKTIADVGDGQSLQISWESCNPNYNYTLHFGTTPLVNTDSALIPTGECSYIVNGLTEGVRYFFSISSSVSDGYPSAYATIANGTPSLIPKSPINMNAHAEQDRIRLNWKKNKELDLAQYRVYRNDGTSRQLYADNITDTFFIDTDVVSQKLYSYNVTSVDSDANESQFSSTSSSYVASFDGGILLVDEIEVSSPFPIQSEQEIYFDSIFGVQPYDIYDMSKVTDQLQENFIGKYSSLFYFDDDLSSKLFSINRSPLSWYSSFNNNMMLSGFRTFNFSLTSPVPQDHYIYNEFGLTSFEEHQEFDFEGAIGENGFPTIHVDTTNQFGYLPYILKLQPRTGAKVIYRYNSATDNPTVNGKPCGIMYESDHGKRVLLAFPLYFLTHESASTLLNHLISIFGESITLIPGDLDNSGLVDIADLVYLVDFSFITNIPPLDINSIDVNGSCENDISDLVYFVNYLFGNPSGPAPVAGCIR